MYTLFAKQMIDKKAIYKKWFYQKVKFKIKKEQNKTFCFTRNEKRREKMEYNAGEYDVAVVGAGHAGCEAALAAARLGMKTLIFSISLEAIANMPCNPHIGGSSKGHLVREIDALGGEMGKNIDKTMIQIKMLNTSKGPAVHSLRAQADRKKYQAEMKHTLEKQENLEVKQGEIVDIIIDNGKFNDKNIALSGLEKTFFENLIKEQGIKTESRVLVLTADGEGKIYLQEKGKKFRTIHTKYPDGKTW